MYTDDILALKEQFVVRPVHDIGFKILFSHPAMLLDFLESIYHMKFHSLEYKDRILTPSQVSAKEVRLDLRFECDGILRNMEMQQYITGEEGERILYYLSSLVQSQMMKGKDYDELPSIHHLMILADHFKSAADQLNEFTLSDTVTHLPLTDKVKVYMINLKKGVESITDYRNMTKLQKWCLFLLHGHENDHEGMKILMEEELFRKAGDIMTTINDDELLKSYAFEKSLREMDERVRLRKAKKTGHEEGKIEGRIEGEIKEKKEGDYLRQVKTAIHMIQRGMENDLITELTELSLSQIIEIKKDLSDHQMMVAEKVEDYSIPVNINSPDKERQKT